MPFHYHRRHRETFLAHLPIALWLLAHLSSPSLAMSPSGAGNIVSSNTSASWEFPPPHRPQNLLFWHQALGRHTLNTSSVTGQPQTPAGCGRLGGCGGLSKETICRKGLVQEPVRSPRDSEGPHHTQAIREGGSVEGKNCLISPFSGSWGPQMLP